VYVCHLDKTLDNLTRRHTRKRQKFCYTFNVVPRRNAVGEAKLVYSSSMSLTGWYLSLPFLSLFWTSTTRNSAPHVVLANPLNGGWLGSGTLQRKPSRRRMSWQCWQRGTGWQGCGSDRSVTSSRGHQGLKGSSPTPSLSLLTYPSSLHQRFDPEVEQDVLLRINERSVRFTTFLQLVSRNL
jgi:hypothetical protein